MKYETVLDASTDILASLIANPGITQNELIGTNRLKRTAIFYVFDALQNGDLVRSSDLSSGGRGRPQLGWRVNPRAGHFVAAYFDTYQNYYGLFDFEGNQVDSVTTDRCLDIEAAITDLVAQVARWQVKQLCGVAVSLSGTVDAALGLVRRSRRWDLTDYPLAAEIAKRFDSDAEPLVIIENNARMAAWGEHAAGKCQGYEQCLTLHLHGGRGPGATRSLGLGSGMVLDGHLFRGLHGTAGELDRSFYRWLEEHRSGDALPSSLADLSPELLDAFARNLGQTFANLVNYIAPEAVLVTFDQEPRNDRFVDAFFATVRANLMEELPTDCALLVSDLGEAAVLYGGADLLHRRFFDRSPELLAYLDRILRSDAASA